MKYFIRILVIAFLYAPFLFAHEKQPVSTFNKLSSTATNTPTGNKDALDIVAETIPPQENRYDVLSKILTPLISVFFGSNQSSTRAVTLRMSVEQAFGTFPNPLKGASIEAALQYPDKVRLKISLGDNHVTLCRNGDKIWAFPGSKISSLLNNDSVLKSDASLNMPLALPFTPQQAMLLPALFQLDPTSELASVKGTPCSIIHGSLMPELANSAHLEDLSTTIWVAKGYLPKRIDLKCQQFAVSIIMNEIAYSRSLPASTWFAPKNETDIYRCKATRLQELLNIAMQIKVALL